MKDTEITAGRKTATFEYPNQDRRFVDDLGKLLRKYTITGIICEPFYLQKKQALIKALTKPGLGVLVHPTDGRVNVVAKPYTIVEDLTRAGEGVFRMEFEEATEGIYPAEDSSNIAKINDLVDSVFDSIEASLSDIFEVTTSFTNNLNDAQNLLTDVGNRFDNIVFPFANATSAANDFANSLKQFQSNMFFNIKDPSKLASGLTDLFSLADNVGSTAIDKYTMATGFFGFGEDDAEIIPNTAQRLERKRNRQAVNAAMNMGSLANAYNAAVDVVYANENDLNATIKVLNDQYNQVIENSNLSDDAENYLISLRNEVRKFFNKTSLIVSKIETVRTEPTSLTNLVYAYYGDLDKYEEIRQLNAIANPALIAGDIKILSAVITW